MPINLKDYPSNWKAIALQTKHSAGWVCQQCHRPCRRTGESLSDFRNRIDKELQSEFDSKPQRFTLTTAHLNHTPMDCDPTNLKALCSVCHLRYDAQHHAKTRASKKSFKQLSLFEGACL